jgi:hypothetical protein
MFDPGQQVSTGTTMVGKGIVAHLSWPCVSVCSLQHVLWGLHSPSILKLSRIRKLFPWTLSCKQR